MTGEKGEGRSVLLRIGDWGEVGWRGVTAVVSGDDKLEGPRRSVGVTLLTAITTPTITLKGND